MTKANKMIKAGKMIKPDGEMKFDNMIKVENLSYSFPQKDLYKNISFTLEDGQHCAFIGASGCGKSTLMEIIMDPERYMFDGKLEINPAWRIGYVSQFSQPDKTKAISVFEYVGEEFIALQNQLNSICIEMETDTDSGADSDSGADTDSKSGIESLLEKYQQVLDAFDAIGGNDFESRIDKKLNLAHLSKQKHLMVSELSGGEFKLIQVIKQMLTIPELMIMDEPDVFLDFDNINSLKNLINSYKGIMVVITHNRYLLNHCFNKIIHLENRELQEFDGRYIDYNFALLQQKIESQELAIADTDEIGRNDKLIDKLRDMATNASESSKGRALNARVKIQERLESRRIKTPFVEIRQPEIKFITRNETEETVELKENETLETVELKENETLETVALKENETFETVALSVNNYSVAFEETLLKNVSFEIKATDKVALIGANGTGKTTLLRDIYKNSQDSIVIDEKVEMAYLSQLQGEMLNENNTIMEEFFEVGFETSEEIGSYISTYGFEEEAIHQKVSSLSGGERNILQLAKISAGRANLLLLDEPTSHLDTYSQIALEKAIENYEGAILMISHDFYSIVNCMDFVLIIEDKTIRKMSMKKFRKMIYSSHFDRDYLEIEPKKKSLETKIAIAMKNNDFGLARELAEELGMLIK